VSKELRTEAILSMLARVRAAMPPPPAVHPPAPDRPVEGVEDFEYETVLNALESVAADLGAALESAHAKATADALGIYYAAEELARDPAHAELIPHVEAMRQAYEREVGRMVPRSGKGSGG